MPPKATKEVSVKEADQKAAAAKSKADCEKGILDEAQKLFKSETHSIQQMMAYCKQMSKVSGK